ncbi:MAG: hypothetical protein AAF700_11290 [Pseudomonadota bacterium]
MDEGQIGAFRLFLDYGPLGLSGLTLVLAVFALVTVNLDDNRFKLLRLVLISGIISLLALLFADYMAVDPRHEMRVGVWPLDGDAESEIFPVPLVKVDEEEIDRSLPYIVADDIVVSVDVSRAIAVIEEAQGQITKSAEVISEILEKIETVEGSLRQIQLNAGTEGLKVARELSSSVNSISRAVDPNFIESLNIVRP